MAFVQHTQQQLRQHRSARTTTNLPFRSTFARRPSMAAAPAAAAAAAAAQAAAVIDGKKIAEDIRKEIAAEVAALQPSAGRAPGLAVVLVGGRKDSETYVRSKKKACAEVGGAMCVWYVGGGGG